MRRTALLIAALSVSLVVGMVATLQINANGPASRAQRQASTTSIASAQPTAATTTARPAQPTVTPTPTQPVALTLVSVEQQPSQGGMIMTIDIANHQATPLNFQFAPEHDLQITDARGRDWPSRWAEYAGAPSVAPGQTSQLVRAFVAGDVTHANWPLTVTARHLPEIGQVAWQIDQQGTFSPVSAPTPDALPTLTANGPVSLRITNVQPSSQLGGIQVDLIVRNDQSRDLVFNFDPNRQVSAQDDLERPYNVGWAQYGGIVHVAPHQTVRLARVFLVGPLDNGNPTWLKVTVKQVPGTTPVEAVSAIY